MVVEAVMNGKIRREKKGRGDVCLCRSAKTTEPDQGRPRNGECKKVGRSGDKGGRKNKKGERLKKERQTNKRRRCGNRQGQARKACP
jgi:hypothetical protein